MRKDSIQYEECRLEGVKELDDYQWFYDRHRVFPAVFENRQHKKILDISAGVGCAALNIQKHYPAEILCNDISPTCLKILSQQGLPHVSFDLDDPEIPYPFPNEHFDAIISLVTIEHLLNIDYFMSETKRILCDGGYLYICTPNYASLNYLLKLCFDGKSFHDPLSSDTLTKYEFYAHVRYFTYRTLLEYVSAFGFTPDTVYVALPESNTQYLALCKRSKIKGMVRRYSRWLMYHMLSPRWIAEPILCFRNAATKERFKLRKVIL